MKNAYGLFLAAYNLFFPNKRIIISYHPKQKVSSQSYSFDYIKKLLHAVSGKSMEMPVLLAAWMTLRVSETAALDFATSIDFKNHRMYIHRAMIKDAEGHFIIIERNKTIDSNRILHIPDYIYNKLKIISEKQEYVTNIKPHQHHQKLRRITDAAGLPPIRFHDLRHISASVMLALGVNDKIAQKRGGWSQNGNKGQNILKSVYQHTFSEQKQPADITIDECFNKPVSNQ